MRRKIIPYQQYLKHYARDLRKRSTKSEILMWSILRRRQVLGYKFLRQCPILWYIADFYAYELNLVLELDGLSHHFKEVQKKDRRKEKALRQAGLHVMRFPDREVLYDTDNVLAELEGYIRQYEQTHGLTPPKRQSRRH